MNMLLVKPEEVVNGVVQLGGRRARHADEWLKAKPGQELRVGVLNGQVGTGLVRNIDDDTVELELRLFADPPTPRPVTLILALPRPKVFGRILQMVTSLGVKRIAVCHSYQVEKAYWSAHQLDRDWVNHQLVLGLEQSGDTLWPQISFHRRLKPFVEDELRDLTAGFERWIAHPGASVGLPSFESQSGESGTEGLSRKKHTDSTSAPIALAIGPEGGWIPYEVEMFERQGFRAGHFGSHILKCETAIAAIIGHMVG